MNHERFPRQASVVIKTCDADLSVLLPVLLCQCLFTPCSFFSVTESRSEITRDCRAVPLVFIVYLGDVSTLFDYWPAGWYVMIPFLCPSGITIHTDDDESCWAIVVVSRFDQIREK